MFPEDRKLLQRFRKGNREAMTLVFDFYSPLVIRYLRSGFEFASAGKSIRFAGVHERHELHDVLAETFRRAFEEKARLAYNGLSPYDAYLRTIARNVVIDRLRAKASSWSEWDDSVPVQEAVVSLSCQSAQSLYERSELAELLERFLAGLEPGEREFVDMRYTQRLSQEAIADQCGHSRRWVRKAEQRIRRKLLLYLKDTGYLPAGDSRHDSRESPP